MLTVREVAGWVGRPLFDPYDERVGPIADHRRDAATGVPEWLTVALDSDGLRAVPLAGAVESGFAIRVPYAAERVRSSPPVGGDGPLDLETERALAEHYGLVLDTDASPSGIPRRRAALHARAVPVHEPPRPLDPPARERIAAALRRAHALEEAGLRRLQTAAKATRDPELAFDLRLHRAESEGHAEHVRERLHELGADRSMIADALARLQARAGAPGLRARGGELRELEALEQAEIAAYRDLEAIARAAGDERSVELAVANRADEEAMLWTLGVAERRRRER